MARGATRAGWTGLKVNPSSTREKKIRVRVRPDRIVTRCNQPELNPRSGWSGLGWVRVGPNWGRVGWVHVGFRLARGPKKSLLSNFVKKCLNLIKIRLRIVFSSII